MSIHLSSAGLEKSYQKGKNAVPVLRGVDFEIEHGEHVAIVGASGSGKSTLLHVLGLLDAPDAGVVRVDGERVDDRPDKERDALRNRTFGFIFQFYHLLPELTALENVMMPNLIRFSAWSFLKQRGRIRKEAAALLDRVGLSHRLDHYPSELSGGEMQRAAIAKTRDIGVLKALGASTSGVRGIFLGYGLLLGMVGSGVGMIGGLLFVRYINTIEKGLSIVTGRKVFDDSIYYFNEIPTLVEPWTVIMIVLGALFIAAAASVWPAQRAAKLHPVRALRFD